MKKKKSEGKLALQEVADMLKVSIVTLIAWRKEGRIKAIKIGTIVRYDPDEIKKFYKEHREKTRRPRRVPF